VSASFWWLHFKHTSVKDDAALLCLNFGSKLGILVWPSGGEFCSHIVKEGLTTKIYIK
jgi:hypothetical protein